MRYVYKIELFLDRETKKSCSFFLSNTVICIYVSMEYGVFQGSIVVYVTLLIYRVFFVDIDPGLVQ